MTEGRQTCPSPGKGGARQRRIVEGAGAGPQTVTAAFAGCTVHDPVGLQLYTTQSVCMRRRSSACPAHACNVHFVCVCVCACVRMPLQTLSTRKRDFRLQYFTEYITLNTGSSVPLTSEKGVTKWYTGLSGTRMRQWLIPLKYSRGAAQKPKTLACYKLRFLILSNLLRL